jgi:hypothetical protein
MPVAQVPALASVPASATVPPPPPPIGAERRAAASPAAPYVADQAAPAPPWRLIAAVAGAIVVIAGACGATYVLFLRDRGLSAFPAPTATLSPTRTSTTVSPDLTEEEGGTREPLPATAEPTEPPAVESPTEPAAGDDQDQPTAEPTIEPTSEPTVGPTLAPTVEPTPAPTAEPTATADPGEDEQPGLPSPTAVVDEFLRVTLGTVPGAAVDYDRARALMTVAYAAEFESPEFVPLTYGIQDGPTSYELTGEEVSGATATIVVLGYWGADLGRQWRFTLEEEAGLWRVGGIDVLEAGEPDGGGEAQSPFWELNPVLETFTVYPHGGWELVVRFDPPAEDIGADVRIEYRRDDDGSLAYSQESSGIISAGRVRLTLDSDWTSYDLSQLGFRPGGHRVTAYIDGVEIASGELTVE